MLFSRALLLPLALACVGPAFGQRLEVGDRLPPTLELAEIHGGAAGIEEYAGRALLIEFFAYW